PANAAPKIHARPFVPTIFIALPPFSRAKPALLLQLPFPAYGLTYFWLTQEHCSAGSARCATTGGLQQQISAPIQRAEFHPVSVFTNSMRPPAWCELETFDVVNLAAGESRHSPRRSAKERVIATTGSLQVVAGSRTQVTREG